MALLWVSPQSVALLAPSVPSAQISEQTSLLLKRLLATYYTV